MDWYFWLSLVFGIILLTLGIDSLIIYKKHHAKKNLVQIILIIITLIVLILGNFTPSGLFSSPLWVIILISVAFLVILFFALFYWEIKGFLNKIYKKKN